MDSQYHFLGEHSKNVAAVSLAILDKLGITGSDKRLLKYGALLHDIGKIYVPKSILLAPRKLSNKEFELVKDHPIKGYEMILGIKALESTAIFIKYHHYRKGAGYPEKLDFPVDSILIDALTAADSYCAIKESRAYNGRKEMNHARALKILKNENDWKNKGVNQEIVDVLGGING